MIGIPEKWKADKAAIRDMSIAKEIRRIAKLDRYVRPEKITNAIKLDSNENFALDRDFISQLVTKAAGSVDVREYPIDELDGLYEELSKYTKINKKYIAAGSGSDQIIELLLSTLAAGEGRGRKGNKRRATVFVPTFSYFINRCELHGLIVDRVPLDSDFELDIDRFVKSAKNADLVYICSPNNPTGGQIPKKVAFELLDRLDSKKNSLSSSSPLVLVDEAYVDFSSEYSLAKEATKRDNLIVLRTLSKAFGLAGARVGYMVANDEISTVFRSTIQSPYPVSTLSLKIATAMLQRADLVIKTVQEISSERRRMYDRLSLVKDIRVFRSDANFLLVETGRRHYSAITKALEMEGIVVKLLGNVGKHRGCMRITIGTADVNDRVIACIEKGVAAIN